MRVILAFLAFLTFVPTGAHAAAPAVIGYLPAFKGFDAVAARADLTQYTHVDLAFANPGQNGDFANASGLICAPSGDGMMISDAALRAIVDKAHRAHAKLLVSVGGGTIPACSGNWATLAAPESRASLVAGLLALVDRYGLDGVDVDLEGELMTRMDRDGNYTPFVRDLSDGLRSRSKLLTCATGSYVGGMVPDAALPFFDLIGIMSYDAIGPTWGTRGDEHASYAQAEKDLALWLGKGVSAEKLALGLPFYGHGFGSYRPSWALREIAAEVGERTVKSDVVGKRCPGCDYVTFNGVPTLERKARLAGAWGAGVMVWEIDQDLPRSGAIRHVRRALEQGRSYAR